MFARLTTLFFLALVTGACFANDAAMSLEFDFPEGRIIPPGEWKPLTITATNNGPDTWAGHVSIATGYFATPGHRTFSIFPISQTVPPCTIRYDYFAPPPPTPVNVFAFVNANVDQLDPGESVSCLLGVTTFPEAAPVIDAEFDTVTLEAGERAFIVESISIISKVQPTQVPVIGAPGMLLLGVFLVLLSAVSVRRKPAPDPR